MLAVLNPVPFRGGSAAAPHPPKKYKIKIENPLHSV